MKDITLEELLEAGCHFGHQVIRHNPKARDFVYEQRDGIDIIDLGMTKQGLEAAGAYLKELAQSGGTIIIVGSKRQAAPIIRTEVNALRSRLTEKGIVHNVHFVTNRWIGGTLTNIEEVKKNYRKLADLKEKLSSEFERQKYTKKEVGMWEKDRVKLEAFYGGIADLTQKPDAIVVIDTHNESLAVREANRTNVTVVGMVDTNADPDPIDYVIPANDDAIGSLSIVIGYLMDAWYEGRTGEEAPQRQKVEAASPVVSQKKSPEESQKTHEDVPLKAPKTKTAPKKTAAKAK